MKKINLRDYYPFYTTDTIVEVPDEVADLLHEYKLNEAAYILRTYRHKAYFSLDYDANVPDPVFGLPTVRFRKGDSASYDRRHGAVKQWRASDQRRTGGKRKSEKTEHGNDFPALYPVSRNDSL